VNIKPADNFCKEGDERERGVEAALAWEKVLVNRGLSSRLSGLYSLDQQQLRALCRQLEWLSGSTRKESIWELLLSIGLGGWRQIAASFEK
jgi:hypothetical protein